MSIGFPFKFGLIFTFDGFPFIIAVKLVLEENEL
nr:MAG TPA: 2-oxo-4-hydroxy-4-carboxy-5-ureidoimidazoline decarboxylase [Caudoviricetes sp.]DAT92902.1 MAG TPA: 2-oxo-4-hydroxy-4-carboxy-5-ureidoimidazoline decarboxylase [Caudoviricetes sp.]